MSLYVSMGEKTKVAYYFLGVFEKLSKMIEDVVEVPADPRKKRKFIMNFIKQAVEDKLAEMSQKEEGQ